VVLCHYPLQTLAAMSASPFIDLNAQKCADSPLAPEIDWIFATPIRIYGLSLSFSQNMDAGIRGGRDIGTKRDVVFRKKVHVYDRK
jgi:hypothetical protein